MCKPKIKKKTILFKNSSAFKSLLNTFYLRTGVNAVFVKFLLTCQRIRFIGGLRSKQNFSLI